MVSSSIFGFLSILCLVLLQAHLQQGTERVVLIPELTEAVNSSPGGTGIAASGLVFNFLARRTLF